MYSIGICNQSALLFANALSRDHVSFVSLYIRTLKSAADLSLYVGKGLTHFSCPSLVDANSRLQNTPIILERTNEFET